jgi:hypothetical protein
MAGRAHAKGALDRLPAALLPIVDAARAQTMETPELNELCATVCAVPTAVNRS